jgi:anaerobic selenocysteine-containing dehydrogenase
LSKLGDRLNDVGRSRPEGLRFLLSAHASHEELFLVGRLVEALLGVAGGASAAGKPAPVTVSWRVSPKQQPPRTTFKISDTDAPNVRGAERLGFVPTDAGTAQPLEPDVTALRNAVESGQVSALYVLDPGPDGSLGDVSWILEARAKGRLPLLVVQGVLMTDLARAADIVLPGATWVEKEASYTNDQGRLQGTGRAIPTPGEAMEDWQILVKVSETLGVALPFDSSAAVRAAIAGAGIEGLEGAASIAFGRPLGARHWLEGSNPSERWKWDVLFQDLPPVKGAVDPVALPLPPGAIQLKEVKVGE